MKWSATHICQEWTCNSNIDRKDFCGTKLKGEPIQCKFIEGHSLPFQTHSNWCFFNGSNSTGRNCQTRWSANNEILAHAESSFGQILISCVEHMHDCFVRFDRYIWIEWQTNDGMTSLLSEFRCFDPQRFQLIGCKWQKIRFKNRPWQFQFAYIFSLRYLPAPRGRPNDRSIQCVLR